MLLLRLQLLPIKQHMAFLMPTLEALIFTEYRRKVLALLLLHPDERLHQREITRLTGTVSGTLSRELAKLTEAGILLKTPMGNQMHYAANRQCPIFDELASILRKTSGLADVLAGALLPWAGQIDAAFVFGSMASGKASSDSDIDLMIIGDAPFAELVAGLYLVQSQLGREINPKVYRRDEWQQLVAERGGFVRDAMSKPRLWVMGSEAHFM